MSLFRPHIDQLAAYVPGEQPQEPGWIKLNTNENPHPPSPRVVEAIQQTAQGRLNLYPDPLATRFREAVARLFDLDPDWVLPANGSDENLTLLFRSFVDPGERVVYPYPSYILYETLAEIQAGRPERLLLDQNWQWEPQAARRLVANARLVLVPNPNSPSGNRWPDTDLLSLLPPRGVLVIDEAYGDFCDVPHRGELLRTREGGQIVITRSLSKSYSLAGIRMGFALAHPDLIRGMRKVKDSYNCDTIALAAATAAILDQDWMLSNAERLRASRRQLTAELRGLGFHVPESQANFVWATHPRWSALEVYQGLKARHVLVRHMTFRGLPDAPDGIVSGLRISVGNEAEMQRFSIELRSVMASLGHEF